VARGAERLAPPPAVGTPSEGHVVLIGLGFAGRTLARVLRARGIPYAALEANAATVHAAQQRGEPVIWGDASRRALLERLGIERARLVAVAISDPVATREVVLLVRSLAPAVAILGRTRFVRDADRLGEAGANRVVAEEFESTLELVSATLEQCGSSRAAVARFTSMLRDEGYELLRAPAGTILDPWLAELLEETEEDA
jgi:CPA2 family monovalent cation:H+ antiporter-2